jgi:hypothetical protein
MQTVRGKAWFGKHDTLVYVAAMFQLIAHCFTMLNFNDESKKVSEAPGEDYLGNTVRTTYHRHGFNAFISTSMGSHETNAN